MKSNCIILAIVSLFGVLAISAQNVEWHKENFPGKESEYKLAYKAYDEGNRLFYNVGPPGYEGALVQYLDAYTFNPNNDELNFHIGHIYFALHHPHDAEIYYEKAILLNPKLKEQILYELANSYHQDGEWDIAIAHYKEYIVFLNEGGHKHLNMHERHVQKEIHYTELCINQCETGKILTHDTLPIIFENISPSVNTKYPEYSPVLNHNEDLLIFGSRRPGNKGNRDSHGSVFEYEDIYYSRRDANGWSNAKHLTGNANSHVHEAPVWVNGDGTRLLLYYNKSINADPHKQGDIYESDFVDGAWTNPTPMKMINSNYRETHASISNDGKTIYFTTNNPKYAIHGGMDIVKTIYNEVTGKWSEPVDVGSKINTEWDEESPFIKPDGKHFYFSSQGHTSIGGFDFFRCELKENGEFSEPINMGFPLNTPYDDPCIYVSDDGKRVFFNSNRLGGSGSSDIYEGFILSDVNIPIEITVKDSETKELITGAKVLINTVSDQALFKEIVANNNGIYSVYAGIIKSFDLTIMAEGYSPTQYITINTRFEKLLNFDTVVIRHTVYLTKDYSPPSFNGQFFDKVTGNPVDGIAEITTGNEKIGHITTVNSKFSTNIPQNKEYTFTALAKGYMPYRETFMLTPKTLKKDFYLDRIKVGDRFAMRNILFETNKSELKSESITELEILKEFINQNPDIKIEISAHTDIKGSHSLNMKLSDSRAKSIYTWLATNGIGKERITYKGYGPDLPLADNNTEEGRILNRRAEIKVIE